MPPVRAIACHEARAKRARPSAKHIWQKLSDVTKGRKRQRRVRSHGNNHCCGLNRCFKEELYSTTVSSRIDLHTLRYDGANGRPSGAHHEHFVYEESEAVKDKELRIGGNPVSIAKSRKKISFNKSTKWFIQAHVIMAMCKKRVRSMPCGFVCARNAEFVRRLLSWRYHPT